jgi:hypothetical protein
MRTRDGLFVGYSTLLLDWETVMKCGGNVRRYQIIGEWNLYYYTIISVTVRCVSMHLCYCIKQPCRKSEM